MVWEQDFYLKNGDCLDEIKCIENDTIDLILTDPPYNIGKAKWDKIDNYISWCAQWLQECVRVLKPSGTLIFWHNDLLQYIKIIDLINTNFCEMKYNSAGIWIKPNYRKVAWGNCKDGCVQRSWFNITEMFFVFNKIGKFGGLNKTGTDAVFDNPELFMPIKNWYKNELKRLNLTTQKIAQKYTAATGRKPYMLRHYFCNVEFEIPTKTVWENVYMPLGFNKTFEELRGEFEALNAQYKTIREKYEAARPVFNILKNETYSNIFYSQKSNSATSSPDFHPCAKPIDICEKIIKTHSRTGDMVLDLFAGCGNIGIAAAKTGRKFYGIENDNKYFDAAMRRLTAEYGGRYDKQGFENGAGTAEKSGGADLPENEAVQIRRDK